MSLLSELFYGYRVDVWRNTITLDANGVVSGSAWALIASDVPCYKEPLSSTHAALVLGRLESDNMFSMDRWHFAEDADVQPGDYLKNVTLTDDGDEVQDYGQFWVVRGEQQAFASLGLLALGRKIFLASRQQIGPEGAS